MARAQMGPLLPNNPRTLGQVECINYNTWGVCLPEGDFPATIGAEPFVQVLQWTLIPNKP